MKAYQYDNETHIYIGEIDCQLDPLETKQAAHDIWLLPGNSTWDVPPPAREGFVAVWNGEQWESVEAPAPQPIPTPTPTEIRIAELKAQLDSTDYKIIKCSECSLVGLELPYDIIELHTERQALRDEINELEGK